MTVKWKNEISLYSATCKSALSNGQIPGRKSKPYHVSRFVGSAKPSWSRKIDWLGEEVYTASSPVGVNLNFPSSDVPFLYDPFEAPGAADIALASEALCLKKLDKARDNGFNGAVFLGEIASTWGMFAASAMRITRAWNALRKGNLKAAYAALGVDHKGRVPKKDQVRDRASNLWLEMSYGWIPLVNDVYAAAHKAASMQFPPKFTVRGRSALMSSDNKVITTTPNGAELVTSYELRVETGLTYSVSDQFVAHANSFGVLNPAVVVWELVPLSFVFDWLISVGDWLEGFTRYLGLSFVDGWVSRSGFKTQVVTGPVVPPQVVYRGVETSPGVFAVAWDYTVTSYRGSVTTKSSGFHRTPMVGFPPNRPPEVKLPHQWTQFVTAMGLINQRRK